MIKSSLIKKLLKNNPHLVQKDVESIVNIVLDNISNALSEKGRAEIRGFGTFSKKYIRPRKFINPRTKEVSYLGETAIMHFKPSKSLVEK